MNTVAVRGLLAGGTCIFSNFADQRLYRQRTGRV